MNFLKELIEDFGSPFAQIVGVVLFGYMVFSAGWLTGVIVG